MVSFLGDTIAWHQAILHGLLLVLLMRRGYMLSGMDAPSHTANEYSSSRIGVYESCPIYSHHSIVCSDHLLLTHSRLLVFIHLQTKIHEAQLSSLVRICESLVHKKMVREIDSSLSHPPLSPSDKPTRSSGKWGHVRRSCSTEEDLRSSWWMESHSSHPHDRSRTHSGFIQLNS